MLLLLKGVFVIIKKVKIKINLADRQKSLFKQRLFKIRIKITIVKKLEKILKYKLYCNLKYSEKFKFTNFLSSEKVYLIKFI